MIQNYIPKIPASIGNCYFSDRKALRKGGHVSLIPGSINIFVMPPTLARVLDRDTKQQECWVIKDKSYRIFSRWSVLSLLSCMNVQQILHIEHFSSPPRFKSYHIYIMRLRQATCSDHFRSPIYLQVPESGKRRGKRGGVIDST